METRASYLLIGGFVLAVIAAGFAFVVWLAKVEFDREFAQYDIYFDGSVAGLGLGGDVRYRGIKVGAVTAIGVDPDDPTRVHVTVELGTETPIRVGDEASLQFQGVTGVSFVNIGGAHADSAPIAALEDQPRPVIPSKPSAIEQLFTGAPDLLARAVVVFERFSALLNADNRRRVSNVLADLETVSGTLASRKENIGRIIDSIDTLSTELQSTVVAARGMAERMDGLIAEASDTLRDTDKLVEGDLRAMIRDIRATAKDLRTAANSADALLRQNSEPLQLFTNEGLNQFSKFITEASILVTSMTRLTDRLESEGARFLIGTTQSEFEVQER